MEKISQLIFKIKRKILKLRFQPIRVFCLHHVCQHFDADTMYSYDWMGVYDFKLKINILKEQGYKFISIKDAYHHLQFDLVRTKKYAVLTFDDGYKSLKEIIPWLLEQNIPFTLFINGKYLDGHSYRENPNEQYLTYDELFALKSALVEIGHHGWKHTSVNDMNEHEFLNSLELNRSLLSQHPCYVPFWAYTWGEYTHDTHAILLSENIIPVLIDGIKNYKWSGTIDREFL